MPKIRIKEEADKNRVTLNLMTAGYTKSPPDMKKHFKVPKIEEQANMTRARFSPRTKNNGTKTIENK